MPKAYLVLAVQTHTEELTTILSDVTLQTCQREPILLYKVHTSFGVPTSTYQEFVIFWPSVVVHVFKLNPAHEGEREAEAGISVYVQN